MSHNAMYDVSPYSMHSIVEASDGAVLDSNIFKYPKNFDSFFSSKIRLFAIEHKFLLQPTRRLPSAEKVLASCSLSSQFFFSLVSIRFRYLYIKCNSRALSTFDINSNKFTIFPLVFIHFRIHKQRRF